VHPPAAVANATCAGGARGSGFPPPVTLFNAVTLVLVCIQIAMIVRLRRAAR
jgi:hypothetical protein